MAYVIPDSDIKLLRGVHLDPSYSDTIYFANATEQYNYFNGLTGVTLTDYSYIRVNNNTIKVQGNAEQLYNCNYMMFRNTAYGNKWFYAFVLKAEYINDNTVLITFEIDVIQTWLFEAVLEPCFVEREHQATDVIGDNLLPEPIDIGEPICQEMIKTPYFDNYSIIVCYTTSSNYN